MAEVTSEDLRMTAPLTSLLRHCSLIFISGGGAVYVWANLALPSRKRPSALLAMFASNSLMSLIKLNYFRLTSIASRFDLVRDLAVERRQKQAKLTFCGLPNSQLTFIYLAIYLLHSHSCSTAPKLLGLGCQVHGWKR
jgi:hypothetical protein